MTNLLRTNGREVYFNYGTIGFITIYQSINFTFFELRQCFTDNSLILCYSSCSCVVFPTLVIVVKKKSIMNTRILNF